MRDVRTAERGCRVKEGRREQEGDGVRRGPGSR